jgi:hypothetical protein
VNTIFSRFLLPASWLLAGLLCGCVSTSPVAEDLAGKACDPLANTNAATVLIFISDDCPISNRYAPEFRRLEEAYGQRGVNFWLVHADKTETAAAIREHARQFDLTMPELRDPEQRLLKLAREDVTPSAAVFVPGGKLVYRGRIDDRVEDLGRERARAVRHDLADALDAVLAGRAVAVPETRAIGCSIPRELK